MEDFCDSPVGWSLLWEWCRSVVEVWGLSMARWCVGWLTSELYDIVTSYYSTLGKLRSIMGLQFFFIFFIFFIYFYIFLYVFVENDRVVLAQCMEVMRCECHKIDYTYPGIICIIS